MIAADRQFLADASSHVRALWHAFTCLCRSREQLNSQSGDNCSIKYLAVYSKLLRWMQTAMSMVKRCRGKRARQTDYTGVRSGYVIIQILTLDLATSSAVPHRTFKRWVRQNFRPFMVMTLPKTLLNAAHARNDASRCAPYGVAWSDFRLTDQGWDAPPLLLTVLNRELWYPLKHKQLNCC